MWNPRCRWLALGAALALLSVLLLLSAADRAAAQDSTVSALPDVASVTATDNLYEEQGTCPGVPTACNPVRATAAQIKTYILSGLPTATTGVLGLMEVGGGLSVTAGVVSVTNPSPGSSTSGHLVSLSNSTGALADSGIVGSALLTSATAASTYLALAGGTLTGPLAATSAAFSASTVTPATGVVVGGASAVPTMGGSAEGVIISRGGQGLSLIGDGTSSDITLYDNAGTVAAEVPAGTQNFEIVGALQIGATTVLTSGSVLQNLKGLSFTGTLPAGTAATYACFTSAGVLISNATAC